MPCSMRSPRSIGASRPVRNFTAVITDHRRLPFFSEIVKSVEQELNDRLGFAEAQVTSARPLSDPEKQVLEAEIAKLTGKRVQARYLQDPALLGGAVVQVGSTIYDGSVNGQLDRFESSWWKASFEPRATSFEQLIEAMSPKFEACLQY